MHRFINNFKALLPTYASQYFELSFLAKKFGFEPVVIIWCFIVYCCVSYVFYLYEGRIQGTKIMKGFRYGISIGLLWFFAMLEMVSLKGSPIEFELMMGLSDAIPVTILGLLLGIFTEKSKESDTNKKISIGFLTSILSIIVFTVVYLGGRYIFYCTNIISSGYQIRPLATFIWTLLMGSFIGASYLFMRHAVKDTSPILTAIRFGLVIFGVSWSCFMFFIPMVFEGTLTDIFIRTLVDITFVILSCYISEIIRRRQLP